VRAEVVMVDSLRLDDVTVHLNNELDKWQEVEWPNVTTTYLPPNVMVKQPDGWRDPWKFAMELNPVPDGHDETLRALKDKESAIFTALAKAQVANSQRMWYTLRGTG